MLARAAQQLRQFRPTPGSEASSASHCAATHLSTFSAPRFGQLGEQAPAQRARQTQRLACSEYSLASFFHLSQGPQLLPPLTPPPAQGTEQQKPQSATRLANLRLRVRVLGPWQRG